MQINPHFVVFVVVLFCIWALVFNERYKTGMGNGWLGAQSGLLLTGMFTWVRNPSADNLPAVVMLIAATTLSLFGVIFLIKQPGPSWWNTPIFVGVREEK